MTSLPRNSSGSTMTSVLSPDPRSSVASSSLEKGEFSAPEMQEDSEKGAGGIEGGVAKPNPADDFPDGGLEAWMVILGAWLTSFCTFGYINAFGVYQEWYQTHQLSTYSPSDISWIGSIQLCLILGTGCFIGRLFDQGYLLHIMIFGTIWTSFCLFMTSLAETYWQILLAQGVGLGIGFGVLFTPSVSCAAHWFKRRRALANGVLATGSSTGGIVFPIMLNKLANNPAVGFAWAVRATAFVVLAALVAASFLLRTRLPPKKSGKMFDVSVFKDTTFTIFVMGAFFAMLGLYLPFFYLQTFALAKGVSPNLAFYLLAILNAASIVGRILPNYAADIIGSFNIIIPSIALSAMLIFVLLAVHSTAGVICFALAFGFASGAYVSTLPATIASLTLDMRTIGNRIGAAFLSISVAALLGTPINGWIIANQSKGREGDDLVYWGAAVFSGVSCFVGAGLIAVARRRQEKLKGSWKV